MTELSTHVLDHIIVFHDKSTLQITERAAKHIDRELMEGKTSHLKIGGTTYSKGSISKIMILADYYEQYPEMKPKPEIRNFTAERLATEELIGEVFDLEKPLGFDGVINKAKNPQSAQQMLKGFQSERKAYWSEPGYRGSRQAANHLEEKIKKKVNENDR
jgi:hypothetical protein